jgi:hypothetical protein
VQTCWLRLLPGHIDSSAFWALESGFMGDEMKDECCRITKLVA